MNQLVHSGVAVVESETMGKESRTNDPARTMAEILEVATHELPTRVWLVRVSTRLRRPRAPASG